MAAGAAGLLFLVLVLAGVGPLEAGVLAALLLTLERQSWRLLRWPAPERWRAR